MGILDRLKKFTSIIFEGDKKEEESISKGRNSQNNTAQNEEEYVNKSVNLDTIKDEENVNKTKGKGLLEQYNQLQDERKFTEANQLIQNKLPIFKYLKSKGINYQLDDVEEHETEPSKKLEFMGDYEGTITLTFSLVMAKEEDVIGIQGDFQVYKDGSSYELVFNNFEKASNQHLLFFGDYLHDKGITEFEAYNPQPQNMSNWQATLDTGLARISQGLKGTEPSKEEGNSLVMSRRISNTARGKDNAVKARRVFNMGVELVYDGLESTNASFESTLKHGLHLRLADAETNGDKYHIIISSDFVVEGDTDKVIYIRDVSKHNLGDSLGMYIKKELGNRKLSQQHKKDLSQIYNIISTRSDLRTSTGRLSNGEEVRLLVNKLVSNMSA